jgi:putative PEP-CTERM system histidine kinase
MEFTSILVGINAALCIGLGVAAFLFRSPSPAGWFFSIGMLCLGAEAIFEVLTIESVFPDGRIRWQQFKLLTEAGVTSAWLTFSLTYSRGNYREFLRAWWPGVASVLLVPVILVLGARESLFAVLSNPEMTFRGRLPLGVPGVLLNLIYLLGAVLVLTNLEQTFRASVGTMRWRIKYLVLGLAVVFGARIYVHSQTVLYSAIHPGLVPIDSCALFVGCSLIAFSLSRSRLSNVDLYPSQAVLHRSFTVLLAGCYLLCVGVLAKVVSAFGGERSFPVEAFLILPGLVGMGVILLSDRVRQRMRQFVSRHFHRPTYDYRTVWATFTERTGATVDRGDFCRAVVRLIADTLGVLSVTLWLADDEREGLEFAASTSISEASADALARPFAGAPGLFESIRAHPYPLDIETTNQAWLETVKKCNPDSFVRGGHRLCAPLVSGRVVVGLISVGDRISGVPYTIEDIDLLKAIADQIAAGLLNRQLSLRLVQAKEMEAFQRMSAFLVHDLKNTTSTLSMMMENMATHFADADFRADAIQALGKSAQHMKNLVSELSILRQSFEIQPRDADLNEVVSAALACVNGIPNVRLDSRLSPLPRLRIDPEQIQKLATNLLLNAKDAISGPGEIRIETSVQNGWALLSVRDTGCGMSQEFLRKSLFKPFQTTKKKGLGIGMLHCRMIVEAHQGRIEAQSEPGKGTTIRVLLPIAPSRQ